LPQFKFYSGLMEFHLLFSLDGVSTPSFILEFIRESDNFLKIGF